MKLDENISAVVTGGASGLGKATVTALRALGVKVAIFDLNKENGERVAKELGALYCEVNVMDEASVDAGFEKARRAWTGTLPCELRRRRPWRQDNRPRQEDGRDHPLQDFRFRICARPQHGRHFPLHREECCRHGDA